LVVEVVDKVQTKVLVVQKMAVLEVVEDTFPLLLGQEQAVRVLLVERPAVDNLLVVVVGQVRLVEMVLVVYPALVVLAWHPLLLEHLFFTVVVVVVEDGTQIVLLVLAEMVAAEMVVAILVVTEFPVLQTQVAVAAVAVKTLLVVLLAALVVQV
jgi:hypothetical protein